MKKEIIDIIKEGVLVFIGLAVLLFWGCFLCALTGIVTPETMQLNEDANVIQVAFEFLMAFVS